jgi:aminoglycoside phosphotransferase (APT) family kinase protein
VLILAYSPAVSDDPVIASGRDAELVDLGGGRLLRRPRQARPLDGEAALMRHVRAAGYPVPEAFEVRPDGIVMQRVEGPTMLDDLAAHPWRLRRHARTLAALHRDLRAVPVPDGLPPVFATSPAPDDVVVHGDLHPDNVLLSPAGPVVIDWSNGGRGPAGADGADAWLVMAAARAPGGCVRLALVVLLRRAFLSEFLRGAGRDEAARHLRPVLARRLADVHLAESEKATMRRVVEENAPG